VPRREVALEERGWRWGEGGATRGKRCRWGGRRREGRPRRGAEEAPPPELEEMSGIRDGEELVAALSSPAGEARHGEERD
jgi:hypothetical protein